MKAEFNRLEDLEDNTEQLKGLLEKEKEEKDILQKELDKKIEAIDRLMNNPDYICKDKIKKKIKYYYDIDNIVGVRILENLMEE